MFLPTTTRLLEYLSYIYSDFFQTGQTIDHDIEPIESKLNFLHSPLVMKYKIRVERILLNFPPHINSKNAVNLYSSKFKLKSNYSEENNLDEKILSLNDIEMKAIGKNCKAHKYY